MLPLLIACANTMKPRGDAPFELGRMVSSVFVADATTTEQTDWGRATLMLSSTNVGCAEIRDAGWLSDDDRTPVWEGEHVVARVSWSYTPFDWEDYREGDGRAGWQGTYGSGVTVLERGREGAVYRRFWLDVYSGGTAWGLDGQMGLLEVEDSTAEVTSGTIDHESVDARFSARNCGTQEPGWDTGDSG
ncbi:MAG TPA: hypothetical protein QGF58_12175 [Myxococcota bacterium]|nr:hypothetical protein [Myxococcota bacterium]